MRRVAGFFVMLLGLGGADFCGAIAFRDGGGVNWSDLIPPSWLGNMIQWRTFGRPTGLFQICFVLGALLAGYGIFMMFRGREA
jgi:hypothetical protein